MLRYFIFSIFFWCPFFLLGCAVTPPPKITGAILVVRLIANPQPTGVIAVKIAQDDPSVPMATVRGRVIASRFSGGTVDYAFAIPLTPGSYTVSPAGGLPSFEVAFDVPADAPVYVGRVLLPQGTSPVLEDRGAEDLPLLRRVIEQLQSVEINSRIGTLRQVGSTESARTTSDSTSAALAQDAEMSASTAKSGNSLEMVPVSEVSNDELPAHLKNAFKRYLKLRGSRAFAVEEGGTAYAMASGANAIARAMQDCNKSSRKNSCRLFSVEQTVILQKGCDSPASSFKGWLRLADVLPPDSAIPTNTTCHTKSPR